jgi:hypothetical protein
METEKTMRHPLLYTSDRTLIGTATTKPFAAIETFIPSKGTLTNNKPNIHISQSFQIVKQPTKVDNKNICGGLSFKVYRT